MDDVLQDHLPAESPVNDVLTDEIDEESADVGPPRLPKKKDGRSSANAKKNRKAGPTAFGKIDPHYYRKRPPKPVPGEGFLRDLRHCLINPKIQDRTPGEKLARKLFENQPAQFRKELKELEAEERSAKDNTLNSGPDLGHDAACRVLDRLLAEATS